jgi:hypothetical protein
MSLRKALLCAVAALALPAVPAIAQGLGPPGGTIYAHDVAYRTVGTPADLPNQGPFNPIWVLGNGLASVTNAAPGDANYHGGRWEVREVTFVSIAPTQFTNAEDLLAAAADGDISIGPVVRRFECPLIRSRDR